MKLSCKKSICHVSSWAFFLVLTLIPLFAQQSTSAPDKSAKQPVAAAKHKAPQAQSVEEQIQTLRQELERQTSRIDNLNAVVDEKDARLKKAEQAASDAQAALGKSEAEAKIQQHEADRNVEAVNALQSSVASLKTSQSSFASTLETSTTKFKEAIDNPTALRYRGINFIPYGFFTGDSAYRTHATGGEEATPWGSLPFEGANSYSLSEMSLSGRQSRLGIIIDSKIPWGTLRAYFEGDFLGVGTTSNDNQSTSYIFRQRVVLGEAETKNHWTFSGGQGWSLATENRIGISTAPANMALPTMVDPNYVAGLVWARMGTFRLTKAFRKTAFAISAENPQLLYTASIAGNTPYAVVGSAGLSAGLLNQTMSSCSPSTPIVNYTNQVEKDSAGNTTDVAVPVYKTMNSCANMANISFNKAPDMLVKAAFDPSFGHFEIFGVARFFHEQVFPGETTNSYLYGGLKDIATGLVVAPTLTSAGAISKSIALGGIGGSIRVPVIKNKFAFGAKGLFGPGVGHFSTSNLSDATSNSSGELVPIHNLSGLLTAEFTPKPRLQIYTYFGGDYAGREDEANSAATSLAAPVAQFCPTSATETGGFACTASPTSANVAAGGSWGAHWASPSMAAIGYGSRMLNNSGCNSISNPGYNGSSTGYYSGGSCGAQTRDVQEVTGGYWFDIFKGERSRLRQGFQYSYAVREAWSGASGIGAKGTENMIFTSFRFILP